MQRLLTILFGIFFFIFTTSAIKNPENNNLAELLYPEINNSLTFSDMDNINNIINSPVDEIFSANIFSGPNRSIKVSRKRPKEDLLEFTSKFAAARMQIAALRRVENINNKTIRLANIKPDYVIRQMSIGVSDIPLMSAALKAINEADSLNSEQPVPQIISTKLAYVRANTPATKFTTPTTISVSNKQLECLATAIYFEARGEPYRGQVAVAQVVINRVKNSLYPNTICGVVYQNQNKRNACQFSFACDGIPERINEKKAWKRAQEIAKKVTNGEIYLTEVADATHYHATYVKPKWAAKMTELTQIGIHKFYRFKKGWIWS